MVVTGICLVRLQRDVVNNADSKANLPVVFITGDQKGADLTFDPVPVERDGDAARFDVGCYRTTGGVRRGDGPEGARHYNFAALTTTDAFIKKEPEVAAAAVRAVMATQKALRDDPSLAKVVWNKVFPGGDEVETTPTLIARDAPFYDPTITLEAVKGLNDFAMANKLITQPLAF